MIRQSLTSYGRPLAATIAPDPKPVGNEVLVKIEACGVCHSDLHLQDGHFDLGDDKRLDITSGRELPFTLGHEIAGTVVAAAQTADVDRTALYAVYPLIGCCFCRTCLLGF